ncbi:MAG: hypothetical protein SGJ11_02315 [Phycisphaerae bacterium]|nr:hypothetical protein [Phycisphaerae bacterium]
MVVLRTLSRPASSCCHPPGELTKQESAVEVAALRTIVQLMTGEQEFVDPVPPPPPLTAAACKTDDDAAPLGAKAF